MSFLTLTVHCVFGRRVIRLSRSLFMMRRSKRVRKVKSLVVIVGEGLKWKNQFKSLTGKLAGGLSSLEKLKNVLSQSKLCDIYRALFESRLRYVNVVWVSLSSTELQTLQCLQNMGLSIIESARFKDPWPKNG